MSRFFKALERAEEERAAQKKADAPAVPGTNGTVHPAVHHLADSPQIVPWKEPRPLPPLSRSGELSEDRIEKHLVSLISPTAFEADQYRTLRHVIEQKRRDQDIHTVAVTSPAVGDGKTITSINLAAALAQSREARVLLIDVDLRRPSVTRQLGIHDRQQPGFVNAVLDPRLSLNDIVTNYPSFNLSVIPAGPPPSPPYEVLKSARFAEILEEAKQRFDYILLDTPPLVPFSDCRLIGRWVDGFVVVIAAHKTPKRLIEEGLGVLDEEKVLGIVFNADESRSGTRYGYYYKYVQS